MGFRDMETVPGDRTKRHQVVIATILLLLTLGLVVVVVVVLTSSQKPEENERNELNNTNGSKEAIFQKLWPLPKPCPGSRSW